MVGPPKPVGHLAWLAQPLDGSLRATLASEGASAHTAQPAQARARQPSLPSLPPLPPATAAQSLQPARPCGPAQAARQPSPAEPSRHSHLSQLTWASPARSYFWDAQSFFLRHEVAIASASRECAKFLQVSSATQPCGTNQAARQRSRAGRPAGAPAQPRHSASATSPIWLALPSGEHEVSSCDVRSQDSKRSQGCARFPPTTAATSTGLTSPAQPH